MSLKEKFDLPASRRISDLRTRKARHRKATIMKYGQAPNDRVSPPLDRPEIWWTFSVVMTKNGSRSTSRRKWRATSAQGWAKARDVLGGNPKLARDWIQGLPNTPRR